MFFKVPNKTIVKAHARLAGLQEEIALLEDRVRKLDKKLTLKKRLENDLLSVSEIYKGVALTDFMMGWARCDSYSSREFRYGRYWNNAHKPGQGEWNIDLSIKSAYREESKFFKFAFGTEEECITACKEWAAFGVLPRS